MGGLRRFVSKLCYPMQPGLSKPGSRMPQIGIAWLRIWLNRAYHSFSRRTGNIQNQKIFIFRQGKAGGPLELTLVFRDTAKCDRYGHLVRSLLIRPVGDQVFDHRWVRQSAGVSHLIDFVFGNLS